MDHVLQLIGHSEVKRIVDSGLRTTGRVSRIEDCDLRIAYRGLKIVYPDLCIVNYRSCFVDSGSRLDHELKTMQRKSRIVD